MVVEWVDACCNDADQDLLRTRNGLVDALDGQYFGSAVATCTDDLHRACLRGRRFAGFTIGRVADSNSKHANDADDNDCGDNEDDAYDYEKCIW